MSLNINPAAARLYFLCAFFALGPFVWGYNIGILASIFVHPGFQQVLDQPSPSQKGLITAIYYLGTWASYLFVSHVACDRLGRRYAAFSGMIVTCFGTAFLAAASGTPSRAFAMVMIGRILGGLGTAIVSTSVPMYQSEIAPTLRRGKFVVMNHVGLVAGLAIAFWVAYGLSHWDSHTGDAFGWRLALTLQFIPAVLFLAGLPFAPESPRWLVLTGLPDEALRSLKLFRDNSYLSEDIQDEFDQIRESVSNQQPLKIRWLQLFTKPDLFARLWRAALLHFMAQICGVTAMKYYLPTLLQSLGLDSQTSLLVGGIESSLKIGCTVVEMLLVDRLGRRNTMVGGALVMGIAMLVNGALPLAYPNNSSRGADYVCILFIFLYAFGYSLGFGPGAWVYGSEIFPTAHRAVGLSVAASFASVGSIITAQVWPVGIAKFGPRIYFYFMAINLACVPIIVLLYPETKRQSLESIEHIFNEYRPLIQEEQTDEARDDDVLKQARSSRGLHNEL